MCVADNYFKYQLRFSLLLYTSFNAFSRYSSLRNGAHNLHLKLVNFPIGFSNANKEP